MYTVNTRGNIHPANNTREAAHDDCIELLSSYGIGSRDDLLRVAALLRNKGQFDLVKKIMVCWTFFERNRMK